MSRTKLDFASLRERTLPLSEERVRAVRAQVVGRHARREASVRVARVALPVLLVAATAMLVTLRYAQAPREARGTAPAVPTASTPPSEHGGLVLGDGSRVVFLAPGTELAQAGATGRSTVLVRGWARFDVVHDTASPFRVTAGSVVVEDTGTVFAVRIDDDGSTTVHVEAGSVRVRGAAGETRLEAGDSRRFEAPPPKAAAPPPSPRPTPVAPPASPSWKKLAQTGEYERAYAVLRDQDATLRDDAEELLLAADTTRLAGHADRAVPILRRLLDEFPNDPRAGVAAFTLGRVLFDDLRQPRQAAAAFEAAYGRGGALAEDALAREVEAWKAAGDDAAARRAATRYLEAYPSGRRAGSLRAFVQEP